MTKTPLPIRREKQWNRCDYCGKFIAIEDFGNGKADRNMVTPDSDLSIETWETYHKECRSPNDHP